MVSGVPAGCKSYDHLFESRLWHSDRQLALETPFINSICIIYHFLKSQYFSHARCSVKSTVLSSWKGRQRRRGAESLVKILKMRTDGVRQLHILILDSFLCPWPQKSLLHCFPLAHIDPEWSHEKNTAFSGFMLAEVGKKQLLSTTYFLAPPDSVSFSYWKMEDHKPKGCFRNQSWENLERDPKGKSFWRDGNGSLSQSQQGNQQHLWQHQAQTETIVRGLWGHRHGAP